MAGELERLAKNRTKKFMMLYMRAKDKKRAYEIYVSVALGRMTYEQAIRELRKLALTPGPE